MMKIPEMIAVLQAAEGGSVIECAIALSLKKDGDLQQWHIANEPDWNFKNCDYRIYKSKIKKWQWVISSRDSGRLSITVSTYTEGEDVPGFNKLQKIDSSMIEVDA